MRFLNLDGHSTKNEKDYRTYQKECSINDLQANIQRLEGNTDLQSRNLTALTLRRVLSPDDFQKKRKKMLLTVIRVYTGKLYVIRTYN